MSPCRSRGKPQAASKRMRRLVGDRRRPALNGHDLQIPPAPMGPKTMQETTLGDFGGDYSTPLSDSDSDGPSPMGVPSGKTRMGISHAGREFGVLFEDLQTPGMSKSFERMPLLVDAYLKWKTELGNASLRQAVPPPPSVEASNPRKVKVVDPFSIYEYNMGIVEADASTVCAHIRHSIVPSLYGGPFGEKGSFEVAQLCGIRAKFETRSATFENPAQPSRTRRNFVIAARNSCDGERNSFGWAQLFARG
ncbi:hypothetical protein FA13DRAFT_1776340 [Coprinellus micaceus]|uniref:Uncharacterized protein n=1 Tax=Coprinellus micaceus TaxID=71717 RepID=A0A4Y7T0I1_COPMI|nr:hypothetical protein FA13DRAFT_1776340 [Coprinellus micaceus]